MPLNVTSPIRQTFTGEEILIISLTKFATGEAWTHLVPSKFGGDPRECSFIFKWFINFIFTCFYNRISGKSLEMWVEHIPTFRQAFLYQT